MFARLIPPALVLCASTVSPPALSAQPTIIQTDDPCSDFAWLIGTWDSYSPWGDQTQPTGGTLVFTIGPNGTLEGHIGKLNSYMREIGLKPGMLVYRGFREVRFYDPPGVAIYHAGWSGKGQSLDVTAQGFEWRDDFIGLRPSGELYQSSSAFGDFAGPYRKHDSIPTGLCAPPKQPTEERVPARKSETAMLREILDPDDSLPPIILNPDPCREDDLPRQSLDEVMQEWDDNTDLMKRLEAERALDAVRYPLREMLDTLIFALMFEPVPERRAALKERGDTLHDMLRRIDDEYASDAAAQAPVEEQRTTNKCIIKTDTVLIDLERRAARRWAAQASAADRSGDQSLEVVSVRQDVQGLVPGLYSGEDEETRIANLRDLKTRLENLPADDPARAGLERNYMLRYSRLTQEYEAVRELQRSSDLTPELAADYAARAKRLLGQFEEFGHEDDAVLYEMFENFKDTYAPGFNRKGDDTPIGEDFMRMSQAFEDELDEWERTPEDLYRSGAGRSLRSALDRAFADGWTYDDGTNQIVPNARPSE